MTIDETKIVQAIIDCQVSPLAKETALPLVQHWIKKCVPYDEKSTTIAVEVPFYIPLTPNTIVVGYQDRIASDGQFFGNEWKTAKEPKKNKDGWDSAWWNEDVWMEELVNGSQLAVYALALKKGKFIGVPGIPENTHFEFRQSNPRILVRAAVKSIPPRTWPTDHPEGALFQFPDAMLEHVEQALIVKAEQIRAARKTQMVPWQITGKHCQSRYNKSMCPFFDSEDGISCLKHRHPPLTRRAAFDKNDPGYAVVRDVWGIHSEEDLKFLSPDIVFLSASMYGTLTDCMEAGRIVMDGHAKGEESEQMQVGTAFHTGVAAAYRQLIEGGRA